MLGQVPIGRSRLPLQGWAKPAQGPIDVVDLKVGADITVVTEPEAAAVPPSAEAAGAGPATEAAATATSGALT